MNTKNNLILFSLLTALIFLTSCEDKINLKLDEGPSQLVVDAFITDQRITQKIRLTTTSAYFNNTPSPTVRGANVTITDNTSKKTFVFTDIKNDGNYCWTPIPGDTLALLNHNYTLSVTTGDGLLTATSTLNPTPVIDSILYEYMEKGGMVQEAGYFAQFYAVDLEGRKDYYWIKSFTNGLFDNNPSNINIAEDGAFTGDGADGFMFILPIRQGITRFDKLFQKGNRVKVELHAITKQAYDFLMEINSQSRNGGLFAVPVANIVSTINTTHAKTTALGCFSIASVAEKEVEIK